MMGYLVVTMLSSAVSIIVSMIAFPKVLRFARAKDIVDSPSARKLQRRPVPVLGGIVVCCGMLAGVLVASIFMPEEEMGWVVSAMTVMLVVGTWDDIKDLSVMMRFGAEILMVVAVMMMTGWRLDNLHGLLGIQELSNVETWLLSVVAGVGIINAINLIDGVDGYSSGYGIMACCCFGVMFYHAGAFQMLCLAMVMAAALLPFFLHNVFGIKTKMFIGDGGTLMLGMLITVFVFFVLSSKSDCKSLEQHGVGLLAFSLAVLVIPVFDTLRVMVGRMAKGKSPVSPDKSHLHHLFIDMGFSHLGAAMSILLVDAGVVLAWLGMWLAGVSIEMQNMAVIVIGIVVTFGFYGLMKLQQAGGRRDEYGYPEGTCLWKCFCTIGMWTHQEKSAGWKMIRRFVDNKLMGGTGR